MITLDQAIQLATDAHKGQWCRPIKNNKLFQKHISELETFLENLKPTEHPSDYTFQDGTYCFWMCGKSLVDMRGRPHPNITAERKKRLRQSIVFRLPYITHPIAVMDMMNTDEEKIVAVLHDVIEDTKITFDDLESAGVSNNCLESLIFLTNMQNESYLGYIEKMHLNSVATKVKIADITCNLFDNISAERKDKYRKAIKILLRNI